MKTWLYFDYIVGACAHVELKFRRNFSLSPCCASCVFWDCSGPMQGEPRTLQRFNNYPEFLQYNSPICAFEFGNLIWSHSYRMQLIIIIIIMAMKCALYSSETKGSIKYVHDLNILNSWGFKLKVILYQVLAWNTVIKYPATMLIPWVFILYQNKKKQGQSLA